MTCSAAPGRTDKPVMATASLKSSSHRTEPGSSAHRRYCCELSLPSKLNTSVRAVLTAAPSRVTGTAGVRLMMPSIAGTAGVWLTMPSPTAEHGLLVCTKATMEPTGRVLLLYVSTTCWETTTDTEAVCRSNCTTWIWTAPRSTTRCANASEPTTGVRTHRLNISEATTVPVRLSVMGVTW